MTDHLGEQRKLGIRPDVVVTREGRPIFVVDAKYILQQGGKPDLDHHVQVLSYAIALDVPRVGLIYAHDPDAHEVPPEHVTSIKHLGIEVFQWWLDLSGHERDIDRGLDVIAQRVLELSCIDQVA